MDDKILLENRELVPSDDRVPKYSIICRLVDEKFLLGNRELAPSSTIVVDQLSPHGRKDSSCEIGNLSLRAARLVSLSPSYPIRRAFYLE